MPFGPIESNRLILREFTMGDEVVLADIEGSEEMVRFQSHEPFTIETATRYVIDAIAAEAESPRSWIELAVCLQNNTVIGRVGATVDGANAWIWYVIGSEHQGCGYATEAAGALIQLLRYLGVTKVSIECDPENLSSCRLAERLGFVRVIPDAVVEVRGKHCGSRVFEKTLHQSVP